MKNIRNISTLLALAFLVACSNAPKYEDSNTTENMYDPDVTIYWEQHDQGPLNAKYTLAEQANYNEDTGDDSNYSDFAKTVGSGVVIIIGAAAYVAGLAIMGMACAAGGGC